MRKFITMMVLIGILNVAYSQRIDRVNIQGEQKSYFSQSELASKKADGWGNPSDYFLPCSKLNNYYYNIITNTQIISESIASKPLIPHDGLVIEFNAVFLNVEKVNNGITKHAKLTIDNVDYEFSAVVKNDVYGCVPQSTSNKRDGKTSVKLAIPHTNKQYYMSFTPSDLGSVARLGIADLTIKTFICGTNAEFNTASYDCSCKSGYEGQYVSSKGMNIYQCVKV